MSFNPSNRLRCRIVILGAPAVGKSAMLNRYLHGRFDHRYNPTMEEFHHVDITTRGRPMSLDIVDTSGQHKFIGELSIAGANAFMLVFSIGDSKTFEYIADVRENILRTKGHDKTPIVVVGNKQDLDVRSVDKSAMDLVVTVDWEYAYLETSAKENVEVTAAFDELLMYCQLRNATTLYQPVNDSPQSNRNGPIPVIIEPVDGEQQQDVDWVSGDREYEKAGCQHKLDVIDTYPDSDIRLEEWTPPTTPDIDRRHSHAAMSDASYDLPNVVRALRQHALTVRPTLSTVGVNVPLLGDESLPSDRRRLRKRHGENKCVLL